MSTAPANDAVSVLREQLQIVVYVLHGIVTETRLPNPDPAHICNLAEKVLPESEQAIATTVPAAIQPAGDTADKWRTVALQYDGHRMQAIWHLQAMLQDAAKHSPIAAEFLQAAPSSAPVAQAMPSQPGGKYEVFFNGAWNPASEEAYYCMSEKNRRIAQAMPAAPSEAVDGSWLWCKLMDWCKKRGVAPSNYDDLFAIAGEAHAIRALQGKPEAQAGE